MKIALIGAGGKMGARLAANLVRSEYEIAYVEVSESGRARLKDLVGVDCVPLETALEQAEAIVLAVPDTAIGKVASGLVPKLAPGTIVVILDAAAPYAGHLPSERTSPIS